MPLEEVMGKQHLGPGAHLSPILQWLWVQALGLVSLDRGLSKFSDVTKKTGSSKESC